MTSEQDTEDDEDVSKGQTYYCIGTTPNNSIDKIFSKPAAAEQQKLGLLTRATTLLHAFFDYLDIRQQQNWPLMS